MKDSEQITVEVAYALPERQEIVELQVPLDCTALEAVRQSDIVGRFPGLDIATVNMGIFSRPLDGKNLPQPDAYRLQPGDRVELYRPLQMDPKEARRVLAQRAKARRGARRGEPDAGSGSGPVAEPETGDI